jgi:hypothetical protein
MSILHKTKKLVGGQRNHSYSRTSRLSSKLNTVNKRKWVAVFIFIVSCLPFIGGILMLKKVWRVVTL